jgi:hypothetical protein
MEFPHLLRLMAESQFDTIYHEHFSYYSFLTVEKIFAAHGLMIFDVDELTTHGGSLRIYACHVGDSQRRLSEKGVALKNRELEAGLATLDGYLRFEESVRKCKQMLLNFLIGVKRDGKKVVGYGAPAKGNTLLNYCGVRGDFLDYTVDVSPHKQGLFLPGTHIPIFAPQKLRETQPDYVLVLPWNLRDEIAQQHAYIREWGGQFVVPIPEPKVY